MPGRELQADAGVGGQQRQDGVGGRRGPRRVRARARRPGRRARERVGGRARSARREHSSAAATPGSRARRRRRGGATRAGPRAGTSRSARARPGASSWSASTGVSDSVTRPRRGVEHVEERQVGGGDRLPQPLLAERPRPEALDVGHVGVQDERERAGAGSRAQHGEEVQRAVEVARGRRREVAHGDRGREAVVERLGDAAAAGGRRPSARARSRAGASAACARGTGRAARRGRSGARTAPGTPRAGTPGGATGCPTARRPRARASGRSGVETYATPSGPTSVAEVLEHRVGVLDVLDRLQEHDAVARRPCQVSTRSRSKRRRSRVYFRRACSKASGLASTPTTDAACGRARRRRSPRRRRGRRRAGRRRARAIHS